MIKKIFKKIFSVLRNYYVLTIAFFIVWMVFFDTNNLLSQYDNKQELKELMLQKKYYLDEINKNKETTKDLTTDLIHLEKYAREKYLMKRDNEEIYLIVRDTVKKK
jgi:cell division protein FtsB